MKNYEYYLGNISRRNEFLNDFKLSTTSLEWLLEKYKITTHENTSFRYDVLTFLCEDHKNEIDAVELRDMISVLNTHNFNPKESAIAIEEILQLHRYILNDTNPNFFVNKERAFGVIDSYLNDADAEHFKEIFNHLYVTIQIDITDDML